MFFNTGTLTVVHAVSIRGQDSYQMREFLWFKKLHGFYSPKELVVLATIP
jgi:hypothetical protein